MTTPTPIDPWVYDRLLPWLSQLWHGEVTLRFGPNGIEYVREKRQTMVSSFGNGHQLWGDTQFGRTTIVVQHGQQFMIEEERVVKPPKDRQEGC